MTDLSMPLRADTTVPRANEPTDLEVAVSVAQQLLDSDQVLSLREALRLLLRAIGAEISRPRTVRHANGLEFRVIPADSYTARLARNARQLTMADGTVWTVGLPIGWRGREAAWQTPVAADDACPLCGRWTCDPTTCPPSAGAARDQSALARAHAAEAVGR